MNGLSNPAYYHTFRHLTETKTLVQIASNVFTNKHWLLFVFQAPKDEEIDIDLNDPEVMKAASKIQASFRAQFGKKK